MLANFDGKEHLRHRAVSLRQHGFLVSSSLALYTVTDTSTNPLHDCRKLGVVAAIFPLMSAKFFDRCMSINLGCKSHVVGIQSLIEIGYSDYFANKVFSIFVQLTFKYRQNNIRPILHVAVFAQREAPPASVH